MYDWLYRRLGARWAAIFTTAWYLSLILLCILLWRGVGGFRYGEL